MDSPAGCSFLHPYPFAAPSHQATPGTTTPFSANYFDDPGSHKTEGNKKGGDNPRLSTYHTFDRLSSVTFTNFPSIQTYSAIKRKLQTTTMSLPRYMRDGVLMVL
jgi:hypothetical protein